MKTSLAAFAALALPLFAASAAHAACGIERGSVRILSNDFEALRLVADEAASCAGAGVTVTRNQTAEHKNIQVAALGVNPAQYTVAMIANNSLVPLLNDGLVRPLDDLVERFGETLDPNQLIRIDGRVMAVAFMGNAQHLFMRRDILEQAGVEPPRTYDEVLAAARAIREKGLMEHPLAATDKAGWDLAAEFVNMYLGTGAPFFADGSAMPAIRNEHGLKVLATMREMTEFMPREYMSVDANEMNKLFVGGQTAIMNQWGSLAGAVIDPARSSAEIADNTMLAAAPTLGGGSVPAAALWWDGFAIASNITDEDAEASFRAMVHGIRPEVALAHPTVAAWLTRGYQASPSAVGVMATAQGGAKAYPMVPYMSLLHAALGTELADFMQGRQDADGALADVEAAYAASAREAGFLQ